MNDHAEPSVGVAESGFPHPTSDVHIADPWGAGLSVFPGQPTRRPFSGQTPDCRLRMAQRHLAYAVRAGLHGESSGKVIIEDGREAGLQVASHDLVVDDPQLVEGRLDELAPHFGPGVLVCCRPDPAQQERLIEGFLYGGVVGLVLLNDRSGGGQLALYPVLLALEYVYRQGVSQVRLRELVPLPFQLLDARTVCRDAFAAAPLPVEHPIHDDAANCSQIAPESVRSLWTT